jgi:hypothetical protein
MSFSSASWTVPELCVWIAIRDKEALNSLASIARRSLRYADLVHPGAYAARDEVLAAAQDGRITVTCLEERSRGDAAPGAREGRKTLTKTFWSGAELDDATSHLGSGARWCVARPVHARDGRAYRELLVSRDEVLKEWPQRASAVTEPSNATRASTMSSKRPLSNAAAEVALLEWAKGQHAAERTITQGTVTETIERFLKREIGRNEGREWLKKIPREWRAVRGTAPEEPALPPDRH